MPHRWLEALAVLASLWSVVADDVPVGHMQPLGGWKPGVPVEERDDVPSPLDFWENYTSFEQGPEAKKKGHKVGFGRPLIMRNSAKQMPAFTRWQTDEHLYEHYADDKISGVEFNLKETRAGGSPKGMKTVKNFLDKYNQTDMYMVSNPVPKMMSNDMMFLPCMRCGGFLKFLDSRNMWFSRGGSKSVIHYDDQDNINCQFAGTKRFIFFHPRHKHEFEANPNTKKNKFGWVDADLSKKVKGYGAFMGKIDVDAVDLVSFPGWSQIDWFYADMKPGDCLYIPYQWYHQVTAPPSRAINVHVWYWRPIKFEEKECAFSENDQPPNFNECTWDYAPTRGHTGHSSDKKQTKCAGHSSDKKEL